MTTLQTYLRRNNIRQADLAAELGCQISYVSLICSGKRLPSLPLAMQIEAFTKGEVTVQILSHDFTESNADVLPVQEDAKRGAA